MKARLANLIKDPLLEQLELQLHRPNFFYILRFQDAEIRHSNFLAWILNPRGNHGLGDIVLRRVLKDLFSNDAYEWIDEFQADIISLSEIELRREWNNIDLMILHESFAMCIENKVRSTDHSNQLARYKNTVETAFPLINHAFVYLTPDGRSPTESDDASAYQTYAHYDIAVIVKDVLNVYGESLSSRVRTYIDDYLTVIRREVMQDDTVNELARKIYSAHHEAMDFILDNKPDRYSEVGVIFEKLVIESGWVLGSPNKGYTRFLTPGLDKIIPRSGSYGWRYKEAFAFEFDYYSARKKISLKTVIPPGDDSHRALLSGALVKVAGARVSRGKKWSTHLNLGWAYDVTNEKRSDADVEEKLRSIWPEVTAFVEKVESELLAVSLDLGT